MENYDKTQALIDARNDALELSIALDLNESFGHERARKRCLILYELYLRGHSKGVILEVLGIRKAEWGRKIKSAQNFINNPEIYPLENYWWSILVD